MREDEVLKNIRRFGNPNFIKKNYPNEYNIILQCTGKKFGEKLYNYLHPQEHHVCPICGKSTTFDNIANGYRMYCSAQCSANDPSKKERIKQTNLERYGVENPRQLKEVQDKAKETCLKKYGSYCNREKAKATCLERYGFESSFSSDEVKKKIKQTNIERYGVENGGVTLIARQKAKATCLERYGDANYNNREKSLATYLATLQSSKEFILGYDDNMNWICKCHHSECNKCNGQQYNIPPGIYRDRRRHGVETCTILHPIKDNESWPEKEIREYIECLGIDCEKNMDILKGRELDIYIPSKKIAIEFNGCYWHSSKYKSPSYHHKKWKDCFDRGIQLITIWEDWWVNNKEKCKNLIKSKLGIYEKIIYARKCKINEIDAKVSKDFCNKWHIQGSSPASIHLGLFNGDKLVSVMTFSRQRQGIGSNKNKPYELVRYCSGNTRVVGGAGRLFTYFVRKYNPNRVVSYSSNDISIGDLYRVLGFNFKKQNTSSYWYVGYDMKRHHRYSFNKFRLNKMGYDTEKMTESQIMESLPYWKIHDSGTMTWEWNK